MSDKIIDALTKKFQELDLDWALPEDAARAVLRVAADPTANGKSASSIPEWHDAEYDRSYARYCAPEVSKRRVCRS
jgi:hypothetical protein